MKNILRRIAGTLVALREGEATTALLMFVYSFLAMTAYNILKPVTRSRFISDLGADNLPWIQLGAGLVIGVLMSLYGAAAQRLPRRLVIPVTLAAEAMLLVVFWALFHTGAAWVSAAFYVMGFLLAVLLISQFWTLANDIYDARQAKRLFGLIGGGASLGGAMGSGVTAFAVEWVGTNNLLLVSAVVLGLAIVVVLGILRREPSATVSLPTTERGVGAGEAIRLLRDSPQLRVTAAIIALGALAAGILDQQLALAVEADRGPDSTNAITAFLAQVGLWISVAGFIVQVGLTNRIHRSLGLVFALVILPLGLGGTATIVIATGALWAAAAARVLDSSLRYTIDKTTREVLYLPLSADLRQRAKPFVDVTVDRFAKALSGLLALVLIKPWGLNLTWQQLSYAVLVIAVVWIGAALVARREYLRAFRRALSSRTVTPATVPLDAADPSTVEALVQELSSPDVASVIYAIDMLEGLDKRHLITPLLLYHPAARVRARVLLTFGALPESTGRHWTPAVERLLEDEDPGVRSAAMRALAALRTDDAATLLRHYLEDPVPRVAVAAAVVLATSGDDGNRKEAAAALERFVADTRTAAAEARREVAAGLAHIQDAGFHPLLVSLIHDADVDVAREAIRSVRVLRTRATIFVPALCSLLRHRLLKRDARDALVACGDEVVPILAHLLRDPDEQAWVRRHIPATLARVPTQASMDALAGTLDSPDGFLRFKAIEAIEVLRRVHPGLRFDASAVEPLVLKECSRYCNYLTLRHNVVRATPDGHETLLIRALGDKLERTIDRIYRLLGLIYPWQDIADARFTITHGHGRLRSNALEYLDNLLRGPIRHRVMPLLDDASIEERVRHANQALRTRPRDLPDTLAQLIHDDDPVIAATAIHVVEQRELWAELGDDIEYALAHRRVADWYVFEAASWVLASWRTGGRRNALWMEPLPTVELADRLRAVPLFAFVSVDELFRIARSGREIGHEDGQDVYVRGTSADAVQFLLDGSVRISAGSDVRDLTAPAALAFDALVEGRPLGTTVHAVDRALCLRIDGPEFLAMLADSIEMTQGLFRMLLDGPAISAHTLEAPGATAARGAAGTPAWSPFERARLIKQHPLCAYASIDELLALVGAAREVDLRAGQVLFHAHDRPAVFHLLGGTVRLEHDEDSPLVAVEGSTFGLEGTLAGSALGRRCVVVSDGRALRIDRDALFSVLADHSGLLQSVFSGVLHETTQD